MVDRGSVYWLELEAEGRRPVLVLTRTEAIPVLKNILVAPLTRTIRSIPTEVKLSTADGLPADCVVSLDNVRTVPKVLLVEQITELKPGQMDQVCAALDAATGCS